MVIDEPFYAPFLKHTGIDHPMADEIMAHHETDLAKVIEQVSTPPASGLFYQKHISTHMLDHVPLDWIKDVENLFLIRDPRYMVASYTAKRNETTAADLGYTQLQQLYETACELPGPSPLVIDSRRFLEKPESYLKYICAHLGIDFQPSMLKWPAGTRSSDGIWQAHWYDSVNASTGFGAPRTTLPNLDRDQAALAEACMTHFEVMNRDALML